ncbi:MAG: hypothetical protein WC850_05990 [Candidatus Gracilibacteria bacterium]
MYQFKNTERNASKGSDFETKSMLYLIGKRLDSKIINCITFDCFNDISGINEGFDNIWDIQAKNEQSLNPKKIGEYLYTLYKNYNSSFPFSVFIFFCPKLEEKYKIDNLKLSYGIDNVKENTLERIKNGLIEKIINIEKIETPEIDDFLSVVTFVEDNHLSENNYIKAITSFKKTNIKSDDFYDTIFKELKSILLAKKNNNNIENEIIHNVRDVINFDRYLYKKDIEQLVISRIIGTNLFNSDLPGLYIPKPFLPIISNIKDFDEIQDLIENCQSDLSRAIFNKNNKKSLWNITEKIITYLNNRGSREVNIIYNDLFNNYRFINSYFSVSSIKFLISIIIEGYDNN